MQIAANKDSKERKAAEIPAPESIRSDGRSSWSCNDGVEDHSPFETCPGRDAEMIIFWYSASLQFLRITSSRTWFVAFEQFFFCVHKKMPPASFDFNPGADGGRLEPGQLLHTWHQHLVRDVFRRSYDQYPRRTRQTVERTRASGDPNRYLRKN